MLREIRSPAVHDKLQRILSELPEMTIEELESMFGFICHKVIFADKATRSAKSYHEKMDRLDVWADGFAAGGGGELALMSGRCPVLFPRGGMDGTPGHRIVLFAVRDPETFYEDLRNTVRVAKVQKS